MRRSLLPRRAFATAAALTLSAIVTLSSGCSAELPDGVFECTSDDGCPSGWRCFPNGRCYSPSAPGLPLYALCDVDADCLSGTCVRAYDDAADLGQCSESCVAGAECPTVTTPDGEVAGVCAPDVGCLAACTTSDDCSDPDAQSCVVAARTMGLQACVEFASPEFSGRTPCSSPSDCPSGAICVRAPALDVTGVCLWPCSPEGPCPPGATCEQLPTNISSVTPNPMHACVATCANVPNSCGNNALSCEVFASDTRHCVPNGWQ